MFIAAKRAWVRGAHLFFERIGVYCVEDVEGERKEKRKRMVPW
jgi:hypothetical protein